VDSEQWSEDPGREAESESESAARRLPLLVTCPFCHGTEVELFSLFGSQLLTSEYYCRQCRTVFEQVKR
jgi:hypothetical protein